ncbi:hypothetical protein UFOVP1049_57 [uncultured Caudovirales phage]|uniref:Uncharacterized protein n=1 Tax=uncultured Caudovirales phage TaxID=2100421 RepID=A0A6J5QLX0_9CAUD|nr:hypothetical protein UFOVP1049_57 [uncultured Caudovirales phage]
MTGYQSKKKAASAKTIDEVNWADHEPDGRRVAQEPDTYRSVPHGHCTHPKCKEVFIAYIEANKRLAHYEPEGKSPMLLNTSPPQREPLTESQIIKIINTHTHVDDGHDEIWVDGEAIARAIEAAHGIKEKNNG